MSWRAWSAGLALVAGACASIGEQGEHAALTPLAPGTTLTLVEDVSLSLVAGSLRRLESGSRWEGVGTISQGVAYEPVDEVLLVRTGDNHEAFLIVSEGSAVGVYLAAEELFLKAREARPVIVGGSR